MRLKQVATGASAVVIGLAVGGVAIAATERSPSSPSAFGNVATEDGATLTEGGGPGMRHRFGPGHGRPGMHGAIHGEYVVPNGDDGYQTLAMHRGSVQEVSDDSIRVRSEDGYTRTYVVTANTLIDAQREGIGSIERDDEVSLLARVNGNNATALRVDDVSAIREHPFFHRDRHDRPRSR